MKNGKKIQIFSANIDCDLYQGYADCLPFISEYIVRGGFIHLDEYYSLKYPGPKAAVDEFINTTPGMYLVQNQSRPGEFQRWSMAKK